MATVEWDDDNIGKKVDVYKFKKGWTRTNIISKSAHFERFHYVKGYRVCTKTTTTPEYKDPQGRCFWCEVDTEEPKERFGSVILNYRTDSEGNPLGPMGPKSFDFAPWFFDPNRWRDLKKLKQQWGDLRKHDILVNCTEEQYQKMTMNICPEAWWMMDPSFMKIVAAAYQAYCQEVNIGKMIARHSNYEKSKEAWDKANGNNQNNQSGGNRGGKPEFNANAVRDRITPSSKPVFGGSQQDFTPGQTGQSTSQADVDDLMGSLNSNQQKADKSTPIEKVEPAQTEDLDQLMAEMNT